MRCWVVTTGRVYAVRTSRRAGRLDALIFSVVLLLTLFVARWRPR